MSSKIFLFVSWYVKIFTDDVHDKIKTGVARRVPPVQQELFTLPEHLGSPSGSWCSIVLFFLITDFIALIAVNNLLDIQLLPSIPSC